jgi:biotin-dependent carboxylase-like uncharacterized protein
MTSLHVLATGPLVTVQDRGRVGLAHLGVARAGALDGPAAALANRIVGNDVDAAVLEVVLGGLELRADGGCWVAVTGAASDHAGARWLPEGGTLRIATPPTGVCSYVAVAGGIAVAPVLGSRSTDTLAWVGPPRVEPGAVLPVGEPRGHPQAFDTPRPPRRGPLRVRVGPRADWFVAGALDRLCATPYVVAADSNRIGLRLDGPPISRDRHDQHSELPSEGMVLGAVQVPPSGVPIVFLADHPPTGGYPVLAVVDEDDLWQCAQLRPGDEVRFSPASRRSSAGATG